jgi:hypothetical protein
VPTSLARARNPSARPRAGSTTGSSSSTAAPGGATFSGGSLLTPRLKAHLREHLELLRPARLLFVKQPERRAESGRRVFLASTRPGAERLLGLEVEHQDDLHEVDLTGALAGGDGPFDALADPVLVVCTHGKRDRCCARYGGPLYDALRAAAPPGEVWQ